MRLSQGVYLFGTRHCTISLQGDVIAVRVGGKFFILNTYFAELEEFGWFLESAKVVQYIKI